MEKTNLRDQIQTWLNLPSSARRRQDLRNIIRRANSVSVEGFHLDKVRELTDSIMRNAIQQDRDWVRPWFIIKYGPPGSGKSSPVVSSVYENTLGMTRERIDKIVHIDIDKLVDDYTDFVQEAKHLRTAFEGKDEKAEEQLQAQILDRYFRRRTVMDAVNNQILFQSLAAGRDIAMETTGRSVVWPIELIMFIQNRLPQYRTVLLYPWVPDDILAERLRLRNERQERKVPIPFALSGAQEAKKNFPMLAMHCDRVLIVDNSGSGGSPILFDVDKGYCVSANLEPLQGESFSQYLQRTCPGVSA